jgi:hypothetical protein
MKRIKWNIGEIETLAELKRKRAIYDESIKKVKQELKQELKQNTK